MNLVALILFVVAAAIFFLVSDSWAGRYRRTSVALGLGVFTVACIVQLCTTSHPVHF